MKTKADWLKWFRDNPPHCDPACSCERCNNGQEVFLIPSDIEAIQLDAMKEGARRAAELCEGQRNFEADQTGQRQAANWQCGANKRAILTASEQWTEKDL